MVRMVKTSGEIIFGYLGQQQVNVTVYTMVFNYSGVRHTRVLTVDSLDATKVGGARIRQT